MRKKLLFRSWLLLALMLVGAGSARADEVTQEADATLVHTSSVSRTVDNDEDPITFTLDSENEYYFYEGSAKRQGYAFAEFNFEIPDDYYVIEATLSWAVTNHNTNGERNNSLYYLNYNKSIDYEGLSENPYFLRFNNEKTKIKDVKIARGANSYSEDKTDVTAALQAIASTNQRYIIFQWTNNPGGASLHGKAAADAPTLHLKLGHQTHYNTVNKWVFDDGTYTTGNLPSAINGLTIEGEIADSGDMRIWGGLWYRTSNGKVNVPVKAGQIVTVHLGTYDGTARRNMTLYFTNALNGAGETYTSETVKTTEDTDPYVYLYAAADGYITLTRAIDGTGNSNYLTIRDITVEDAPDVYFSSTTCEAELIALNIDEPKLIYPDGAEVTYAVSNTKVAKLGGEDHPGDLMGVNTGMTGVTATVKYRGKEWTASYTLTIKADEATYVVAGNTYTLTGPGKLGERVVNLVPKITTEFGENTEGVTNITIVRDEAGIGPVATTLDSNGWRQLWYDGSTGFVQPVQGSFYTFKPTANGHLTVKGYLSGANSVYLVNSQNLAHVPSDVTAQVAKDGTYWGGTTPSGEPTPRVNGYKMAEKYEYTVATTGDILSQTVSGLANGRYTVVLQANACFTEGREIKGADGQDYVWDASIANDIANVFVESGGVRQTQAVTALNAGSVSSNGRFEFEVEVTNETLTMGMNKTQQGTNWHTIQIESLNYLDAADSHFEPVAQYVPRAGFADNSEVDIEADLEAGQTYYLYANIPSSNGVNTWATYQLQAFTYESAWHFAEKSVVTTEASYAGMEVVSLTSATPSLTYSIESKGDVTATIDANTGAISNISGEGGALVVTATDGTDSDYYVVTVPYANKVWDFWGLNGTRTYPIDLNEDQDWAVNYEVREYDKTTRDLNYLNEPILTAAQAVDGDNAAFIGETAGLMVNSVAKSFGARAESDKLDNYVKFKGFFLDGGENQAKYAEYISTYGIDQDDFTEEKFAELKADGAFKDKYLKIMLAYTRDDVYNTNILAMDPGATIVIPHVKVGSHIAIKWYRHADKDGDHILLTNAEDLDGNAITNGVYVVNQGRGNDMFGNPYGWLEFKAAGNEGEYVDVKMTCESGWTHMKAIVLNEEFYDTNLRITNYGQNSVHKTAFNTTDGADSNTYSTDAYHTFSENGVTYTYHLEDITGTIEGNYTIEGGTISFNQGTQGTATLVLTAFSNGYAIDREWLPIKVGAVGNTHQDYPYTWNFTNIIASNLDGQDNWTKDGNNYTVTPAATTAHLQDNELKKNATDEDGVAEFDEIGIETPTNTDGTPTKIDLTITDNGNGKTTTTIGDEGITLVVPDVPADATVYVKVVPNSNSTVNITNKEDGSDSPSSSELDDNTTVYTIDGADEDVKVNLKNIEIQSIAVTNIFKEARMASASDSEKFYNTDCQPKVIDYSLTNYYTGYDMKAMYITNENFDEIDYDRETAVVTPVEVDNPVPANTGLIVYTSDNEVLHPLFVPDVNTTARQDVTGNMLVGVIFGEEIATEGEETDETAEPTYTTSTEKLYKYVVNGGSAAQTLVDYKNGIGTYSIVSANSKITENQTMLTETGVKFDSNISSTDNYVEYTGSFKSGDVVTLSSIYNSTDTNKSGKVQIIDANGNTYEVDNTTPGVAVTSSVTLTADTNVLKFGRKGGTGTVVSSFTVTRPGTKGEVEKVATDVTIYTGNVDPAESGTYRYLFTNQYNTVGQNNSLTSDEPGFYRLKEAGGKLKSNRAYLVIGQNVLKGNSVKAVYLKSFFNDDPDDDFTTVIELVEDNNAGIDVNGTFYTLSGMRVQGLPTQKGIYIQNGKKVMVK